MQVSDPREEKSKFFTKTLRKHGLPGDIPSAVAAMANMIRNHEHLASILSGEPPELRRDTYEAVRPHLRFEAKPLHEYDTDARQKAEREQLPYLAADGSLIPFVPASDAESINRHAEESMMKALAKSTLTLVCAKCLLEEKFYALESETPTAVVRRARITGWRYDFKADPVVEICPGCVNG